MYYIEIYTIDTYIPNIIYYNIMLRVYYHYKHSIVVIGMTTGWWKRWQLKSLVGKKLRKTEKNSNHRTRARCRSCVCARRACVLHSQCARVLGVRCAAVAMDPTVVVMEHAPPMAECHWVFSRQQPDDHACLNGKRKIYIPNNDI